MFRKIAIVMVLICLIFLKTSSKADLVEWELPSEFIREYTLRNCAQISATLFFSGEWYNSIHHEICDG